jgi:hypothetical protein
MSHPRELDPGVMVGYNVPVKGYWQILKTKGPEAARQAFKRDVETTKKMNRSRAKARDDALSAGDRRSRERREQFNDLIDLGEIPLPTNSR